MTPRISVLIPIHNSERFVVEAVESMLAQTVRELEVVLVDDASTDGSRALIAKLAARDPRIRVLHLSEKRGIAHALNRGMELCAGDWIARMDADDLSLPTRLEKQLAFADQHPDAVLIGTDVTFIDEHSHVIGRNVRLPTEPAEIDRALMWGMWPIVHPSVIIRRATLLALKGYCEELRVNSDHELFLRLAETGRLYSIPERLTRYRLHQQQISAGREASPVEAIVRAASARRGVKVLRPPLRVRLFGIGISDVVDTQIYRDALAPIRELRAHLLRPGAWIGCGAAYVSYAFWSVARMFGRRRS